MFFLNEKANNNNFNTETLFISVQTLIEFLEP